ncbi:RHS repeat domain-containing protein [Chryseobacterium candidae]|uniref:RHS repeat domain-containing protein n=1 Tax=Chryseobacterium candidae TaxID=1978493 RepID=UPI0026A7E9D5|nr:RHS repeat-associated core domain-containing protein [Chryseobacterium candidae]
MAEYILMVPMKKISRFGWIGMRKINVIIYNLNKTEPATQAAARILSCGSILTISYIYQYKDHLGNVRVSFAKNSTGVLEIVDSNDYYPFGMNHLKTGNAYFGQDSFKKYKYNGKELQETGMYDYGARFYMPDIGRWGVVDPLAEKNRRFTPYNYAINNPIRFIDPDGRSESDWVRRGSQVFYDASVKSQADATAAYGENAQHLGEGSTVTSTTNGQADGEFQYTLHNNGTVTDASGNVMDNTQNIEVRDKTIFSNCSDCLNPGTLYKNLFGLTYPGGDNPKTYGGDWSYQYSPLFQSEYPAIGHDRRYDNLGTEGAMGLLTDTRAIGADYKFVAQELKIALNPFNGATSADKQAAGMVGVGLGIAAAPKTIFKLATDGNAIYNIYQDYKTSNKGVSNTPKK